MPFTGFNVLVNDHEPDDQRMQMSLVASILTSNENTYYVDDSDRPYFRAALRTVIGISKGRKTGNWVELMNREPMVTDRTMFQTSITFTAKDISAPVVVDVLEENKGKGRYVQVHVYDYEAEAAHERRTPYVLEIDKKHGTVALVESPHMLAVSF